MQFDDDTKRDWRGFEPRLVEVEIDISHMPMVSYEEPARDVFSNREQVGEVLERAIGDRRVLVEDENLTGFNFSGLDLRKFIFRNCDLSHADFRNARVRGMCVDGSVLTGARFSPTQIVKTTGIPRTPCSGSIHAGRLHRLRRRKGCGLKP